jgi:phage head maturation protease
MKPAPASLDVDAVTYVQREAPNRNFVRFQPGILQTLAKGGAGIPVLRDHDQRSVLSRAGTVTKSVARHTDAGEWEFHQTLRLVKPWAIEGVSDGTLDRFSIGWSPTGPVICSKHDSEIFTGCHCWPGDEVDGDVIEWVFTAAELVEVSFVNVPAVVGTGPSAIRESLCLGIASGLTPHGAVATHAWRSEAQIYRCAPSSPNPSSPDQAKYERDLAVWNLHVATHGFSAEALRRRPVDPNSAAFTAATMAAPRPQPAPVLAPSRTPMIDNTPEGRWAARYAGLSAHLSAVITSPRHLSMVHSLHGRTGDGSDFLAAAEKFAANLARGGQL